MAQFGQATVLYGKDFRQPRQRSMASLCVSPHNRQVGGYNQFCIMFDHLFTVLEF